MINWKSDLILAVILFGVGVAFYITGSSYPETPFLFPSYLAPLLAFLSLWLGFSAIRRKNALDESEPFNWRKYKAPTFVGAVIVAYIGILDYVGFIGSSFLLLATFYIGMGFKNKFLGVALALGIAVLVYALFHVALEVSLPVGSLWETE